MKIKYFFLFFFLQYLAYSAEKNRHSMKKQPDRTVVRLPACPIPGTPTRAQKPMAF